MTVRRPIIHVYAPSGADLVQKLGDRLVGVQVTQNISTSDPARAARHAQREQDRAVRLAQAGALHDTGRIS